MIFVCLFFAPDTLKNDQLVMGEIVERFFSDNWVLSFYMGSVANLVEWWDHYKVRNTLILKRKCLFLSLSPLSGRKGGAAVHRSVVQHQGT